MAGYGLGVVVFGLAGALLCRRVLKRIEREASTSAAIKM
jgi:hypothetical protein